MMAMLAPDPSIFLASLKWGEMLILIALLLSLVGWDRRMTIGVGWDVTVRLSVELVTRLSILSVDV